MVCVALSEVVVMFCCRHEDRIEEGLVSIA